MLTKIQWIFTVSLLQINLLNIIEARLHCNIDICGYERYVNTSECDRGILTNAFTNEITLCATPVKIYNDEYTKIRISVIARKPAYLEVDGQQVNVPRTGSHLLYYGKAKEVSISSHECFDAPTVFLYQAFGRHKSFISKSVNKVERELHRSNALNGKWTIECGLNEVYIFTGFTQVREKYWISPGDRLSYLYLFSSRNHIELSFGATNKHDELKSVYYSCIPEYRKSYRGMVFALGKTKNFNLLDDDQGWLTHIPEKCGISCSPTLKLPANVTILNPNRLWFEILLLVIFHN
ncbi:hypothetical protein ACOME3_000684 [Neoechinorhynchus agilis]